MTHARCRPAGVTRPDRLLQPPGQTCARQAWPSRQRPLRTPESGDGPGFRPSCCLAQTSESPKTSFSLIAYASHPSTSEFSWAAAKELQFVKFHPGNALLCRARRFAHRGSQPFFRGSLFIRASCLVSLTHGQATLEDTIP